MGNRRVVPTAYCLLPTAYCLLPTAYCPLSPRFVGSIHFSICTVDPLT